MRKILVVDDQRGIRLLLDEVFSKAGYHVYQAANGMEALKILKENMIDCMLLDMKIPGMNGLEILKEVRVINEKIPVFMMTAFGEEEIVNQARSLGVINYFTKPFNIFEIKSEVDKVLTEVAG